MEYRFAVNFETLSSAEAGTVHITYIKYFLRTLCARVNSDEKNFSQKSFKFVTFIDHKRVP